MSDGADIVRREATGRLIWLSWVAALLVSAATQYLIYLNNPADFFVDGISTAVVAVLVTTAGLIAGRRPENRIGWIYWVGSWLLVLGFLFLDLAVYTNTTSPGALPGGGLMAVFGVALRDAGWMTVITFPLLLFPDGRLPSRRWRPVVWIALATIAFHVSVTLVLSGTTDGRLARVDNPLALGSPSGALGTVDVGGFLLVFLVIAASALSAIVRFRRAKGLERQQIKWVAYIAVLPFTLLLAALASGLITLSSDTATGRAAFGLTILPIPLGTGIAILRYRLWDIDRIINRTIVYGMLTASLLGLYTGVVLLLQNLLSPLTQQSDLAIALSTLIVAALFNPARRRIQAVVDRRFYRQTYDAQRALARFGVVARDEVDLDRLTAAMLALISDTMQPASLSLWLRDTEAGR